MMFYFAPTKMKYILDNIIRDRATQFGMPSTSLKGKGNKYLIRRASD